MTATSTNFSLQGKRPIESAKTALARKDIRGNLESMLGRFSDLIEFYLVELQNDFSTFSISPSKLSRQSQSQLHFPKDFAHSSKGPVGDTGICRGYNRLGGRTADRYA